MLHGLAGTVSRTSILEAYLPRLRQRPDILLANLAIEIQCSRLSHQRFIERTQNYLNNSYQVWWILGNFSWTIAILIDRKKLLLL